MTTRLTIYCSDSKSVTASGPDISSKDAIKAFESIGLKCETKDLPRTGSVMGGTAGKNPVEWLGNKAEDD